MLAFKRNDADEEPSSKCMRDRVARALGPIVTYKSGPKDGEPVAPDVETWFQQDQYQGNPHLVAQWADLHNAVAQAWVTADPSHSEYVDSWAKSHASVVAEWTWPNGSSWWTVAGLDLPPRNMRCCAFSSSMRARSSRTANSYATYAAPLAWTTCIICGCISASSAGSLSRIRLNRSTSSPNRGSGIAFACRRKTDRQ
jgi:hypothetical protein